jgi:hypothetical protein
LDVDELQQTTRQDSLARLKAEYRNDINPGFRTFGPKTRREYLRLQRPDGRPV